ncbi:MAG: hypothetical protein ACRCRV_03730 [Cetobacterium sp.]
MMLSVNTKHFHRKNYRLKALQLKKRMEKLDLKNDEIADSLLISESSVSSALNAPYTRSGSKLLDKIEYILNDLEFALEEIERTIEEIKNNKLWDWSL